MAEDYSSVNLRGAVFAGRSLAGANFSCANLSSADFRNANVEGADFRFANLAAADFRGARTDGAHFTGANISDTRFSGGQPPAPGQGGDLYTKFLDEKCAAGEWLEGDVFLYENNMWNRQVAIDAGFEPSQCVFKQSANGNIQYGWSWSWPDQTFAGVYAYPEAIYGWKPWSQKGSPNSVLPARIADLTSLKLEYAVATVIESGTYNLAPEIWITRTGGSPAAEEISAELMFWMDYDGLKPAGTLQETVQLDGRPFEVFYEPIMGDAIKWTYVAFRAVTREPTHGRLHLWPFLQYAVNKGYVDGGHFVSSLEFGNEIGRGRGQTLLKRLVVSNGA